VWISVAWDRSRTAVASVHALQFLQDNLAQPEWITLTASSVLDDLLGNDFGERVCPISQL
jgi:hypothetical protein